MYLIKGGVVESSVNKYQFDDVETLSKNLTSLAHQMDCADYLFLKMLSEFDRKQGWNVPGVRSASYWLNWQCGISYSAAREKVRVAHCLDKLPLINKLFEDGTLSYSKVRALTRAATNENEEALLHVAENHTASFMESYVRRLQQVDEDQEPVLPEDEIEQRKLIYCQDRNGMWIIKAKLPQAEGQLMVKALEEIIRQHDETETYSTELENVSAESPLVKRPNRSQKQADALSAMAEHFVATATTKEGEGVKALAGHERCQVVLHMNTDTLKHVHQHGDNCLFYNKLPPANLDLTWISMKNAKRFSCDASILTVLENGYGDILNHGRKTRTVSGPLKRTLDIRDETCRFPGCNCKLYVEYHHILHWANMGETEPDNLIKLCRFHHAMLHRGHFYIEPTKDKARKWIFKTPYGDVIRQVPRYKKSTGKSFFNLL